MMRISLIQETINAIQGIIGGIALVDDDEKNPDSGNN